MRAQCYNPHSPRYGTPRPGSASCPRHMKALYCYSASRKTCANCALWGTEGARMRKLADYLNPIKANRP